MSIDKNESEKDIERLKFNKDDSLNDYKVLVKKLKSISQSIHLLEKNFLAKDI